MNKYNRPHNVNDYKSALSPRQASKLARFNNAFIALNRDDKPIVVVDEGRKPEVTAMASEIFRMTVRDNPITGPNRVRHGAITWRSPEFNGKIGTHN